MIAAVGWVIGRALPAHRRPTLHRLGAGGGAQATPRSCAAAQRKNPFGVPYEPVIWGAGWGIQELAVKEYSPARRVPGSRRPRGRS